MPPRLILAGAVTVSLAACAAGWHLLTRARAADERTTAAARQNAELRFELKQTRERADNLALRLAESDTELGSAKTRTTATETRSAQLTRELSSVRASLSEREQREVALLAQIEELHQQTRMSPGALLPASTASLTSPSRPQPQPAVSALDLAAYERRIAALEGQLLEVLTRALADLPPAPPAPTASAPAETPPQVVQVGLRNAFVVINRGTQHGLGAGDVCAFTRDGTELALGRLSDVRARFAVVHLLPGSLKRQLQPGDIAVLAR